MSRVLVTGGQGLLGSTLVPYLRDRGHDVVSCSRTDADITSDLTDREEASVSLSRAAPDVIVNLAANTDVDECERNPQAAYLTNVRIVENLVHWIRERQANVHLVHFSTDQLYDGSRLHKEDDITLCNYYGFSKYASELAAGLVGGTVLRTNFFGRSRCRRRMSFSDWIVRSLGRGDEISVFDDVCFSPLSIGRLAALVEVAVRARLTGVFNVGSRGGMSKADFAFALADALGLPTATMQRGTSDDAALGARRPKDMRMDSSLFENAFGVSLPTLEEEINLTRADYKDAAY